MAARFGRADLFAVLAVLTWGFHYTAAKVGLGALHPLAYFTLRFVGSSVLLVAWAGLRREHLHLHQGDARRFAVLALVGIFGFHWLWIEGLARTTSANAALIAGFSPLFTALIATVLGVDRVSPRTIAGLLVSFAGVYVFINRGLVPSAVALGHLRGDLLMFAASLTWALYTVLQKPVLATYSVVELSVWATLLGTVPWLLLGAGPVIRQPFATLPLSAWGALGYSIVFPTVVAFLLWSTSIRAIGPVRTYVYINLTPIIGVSAAALLLGEPVTFVQVIGMLAVVAGIHVARRR